MIITGPHPGQSFGVREVVPFQGTVDEGTVRIELIADGKFTLGDARIEGDLWSFQYQFDTGGIRHITANALDIGWNIISSASEHVTIAGSAPVSYHPPVASMGRLGRIALEFSRANQIDHPFAKGGKIIFKLESGELYYDSLLDLDADGSKYALTTSSGNSETSLEDPPGTPVDADAVPYFVLPGGFYEPFGIRLGDIAAVLYKDKVACAIFADVGPRTKLGEGSIKLHRLLGHETIINGRMLADAIDSDVLTIVFPGSGNGKLQSVEKIQEIGSSLFKKLGGTGF